MKLLAIDPGNIQSAFVIYDTITRKPLKHGILLNRELLKRIPSMDVAFMAIEMVACYGMPVGQTIFDTCVWIGRFIQAWNLENGCEKVYRKDVKMHLCNSMRAKDSNIRQAILDRYEPTGGGKTPQIGTKAQPGPLYGVSKDVWAALAVAITYADTKLRIQEAF